MFLSALLFTIITYHIYYICYVVIYDVKFLNIAIYCEDEKGCISSLFKNIDV